MKCSSNSSYFFYVDHLEIMAIILYILVQNGRYWFMCIVSQHFGWRGYVPSLTRLHNALCLHLCIPHTQFLFGFPNSLAICLYHFINNWFIILNVLFSLLGSLSLSLLKLRWFLLCKPDWYWTSNPFASASQVLDYRHELWHPTSLFDFPPLLYILMHLVQTLLFP